MKQSKVCTIYLICLLIKKEETFTLLCIIIKYMIELQKQYNLHNIDTSFLNECT